MVSVPPPGLALKDSTFCPHSAFTFCMDFGKKNSGYFFIQRLLTGFMTEAECVYSAVRAEFLNAIQVTKVTLELLSKPASNPN